MSDDAQYGQADELARLDDPTRAHAMDRMHSLRRALPELRQKVREGVRVVSVRTLPLMSYPYPARFAFAGAAVSPAPAVLLTYRALVVDFMQRGRLKRLLFNPLDAVLARATPYYAQFARQLGDFLSFNVLSREHEPLEIQLDAFGIARDSVDYVAFDHLHSVDLRSVVGSHDGEFSALFPKARVLVPREEWQSLRDPHPLQRSFLIKEGSERLVTERVVLTDASIQLGDGVALLRTPGLTLGHQSLVLNTERGVWVVSSNGVCADSWSPSESSVRGVEAFCRRLGIEVLPNARCSMSMAEQLTSMWLERELADRADRPRFVQVMASSHVVPMAFAPGLTPALVHEDLNWGSLGAL